ncbi:MULTISPECIES: YoaK family protein [unclassified Janthinobacterium]|uniref:YoaK family protein n=1 Tax=unclassified Janthinobacterium TaxID=2610881 RepID=UPI00161216A0|nr:MULTISPECIES: YoaK family protein [unclassified Janthinobacterium]MBB5369991.1 uncharacterized membrane protein YoaK (UPF0700 family) [Janthinobacterium sp. K2C7]MBB5382797.1 uncharacterized membrane protein YoaK (UPF0700 family) [Janthinobacterium sp. K2Li3]MBB5384782.1 uncharacterized membrane protein YoaK (UPF0700 family) [Janthinobacterium sp. K2E3]
MNAAQRSHVQGIGLGFLAGYVDTLGFVALFGLFTAHVTGNFVLIGAILAKDAHGSIALKLLAFPAFILGVAAARLLTVAAERRGGGALRLALLMEWVLLAGCMVCGMQAGPLTEMTQADALAMAAGLFGATAMGAHSAISRLQLSHLAPTSMMTGNVTQLVIDTVDVLRGAGDATTRARCVKCLWPLLGFAAGAGIAAFAYLALGFAALAVPLVILAVLIAMEPARSNATAV